MLFRSVILYAVAIVVVILMGMLVIVVSMVGVRMVVIVPFMLVCMVGVTRFVDRCNRVARPRFLNVVSRFLCVVVSVFFPFVSMLVVMIVVLGMHMILRSMVLNSVAVVVVVLVRRDLPGVDAVHCVTYFEDGLGAVGFVGQDKPIAVLGEDGGVD